MYICFNYHLLMFFCAHSTMHICALINICFYILAHLFHVNIIMMRILH